MEKKTRGKRMLDKRGWKRSEWTMITCAKRIWLDIENGFCGIVQMKEVSEPFCVGKEKLVICDHGITWVQCAWKNIPLWATAMFDSKGNLFQIYFDVCDEICFDGENTWFTDLILDIVYHPDGTVEILDEDELLDAYLKGMINEKQKSTALKISKVLENVLKTQSKQVNDWFKELFEKSTKNPLK